MTKAEKGLIILVVAALIFVFGMKYGEQKALRHQRINSTDNGYSVIYEGHEYNYK